MTLRNLGFTITVLPAAYVIRIFEVLDEFDFKRFKLSCVFYPLVVARVRSYKSVRNFGDL